MCCAALLFWLRPVACLAIHAGLLEELREQAGQVCLKGSCASFRDVPVVDGDFQVLVGRLDDCLCAVVESGADDADQGSPVSRTDLRIEHMTES